MTYWLGGEKGLKDVLQFFWIYATTGVADTQKDVTSCPELQMLIGVTWLQFDLASLEH
jgi:hypothetical protein